MIRKAKYIALFLAVLYAGPLWAQRTSVSGTITDPNGLPYSFGTVSAAPTTPAGQPPQFTSSMDVNGGFAMNLPTGTTWNFTVSAQGVPPPFGFGTQTFTVNSVSITGGTIDLSTTLSSSAPALTHNFGGGSGSPCVSTPNSIQFNNTGAFGCVNIMTFAGGSLSLTGSLVVGAGGSITTSGGGTISATSAPFSGITSATNTTAAMLVGTGASLGATGSGSINATLLNSATFASPGAIGSTTPGSGAFTTITATGNLTTNVIGGGTQCLHVSNAGVVSGTGSDCGSGGATGFNGLTSGTNTAAAMVVGSGASLTFTGSGSIDAKTLDGATFGSPLAIGNGTPSSGAFTTLSATGNLTINVTGGGTQCLHVSNAGVVSGTGSDCGSGGGSTAFSALTGSTNTTAAMVVGTGASLAASGSGSINATLLGGATFASPGAIGGTTPAAGHFTTLSATGNLTVNVTGSTQCLQANTSGVVSGTTSGCGFVNPMGVLGDMIYGGSGGAATDLSGPTGPNGVPEILTSTPSAGAAVAPAWSQVGVPIDAQTGTTYTIVGTCTPTPCTVDREALITTSNAGTIAVTLPQAGTTNFSNSFTTALANIGVGLVTITPTTSTINGNATQIVPDNWFAFIYSDNTNYRAGVFPSIAAFPNCTDTGGNHLNFTSATGALSCGTSSSGGGSGALSAITAAVGGNTIANGNNAQVWNWALTSSGASAFTFGETTAATSGGTPFVVNIQTLATSTANPLVVTAVGTSNGFEVTKAAVIEAIGSGAFAIGPTAHGVIISEGATTAVAVTAVGATGVPLLGNTGADPTYGALNLAGGSSIVTGVLPAANVASIPLNQVISPTGAIATFSDGNNPLTINCAQTTNSQSCATFGESSAATGTGDVELSVKTVATSTAIVEQITQGAGIATTGNAVPAFFSATGGAGGAVAATAAGNVGGFFIVTTGAGSAGGATSGTGGAGGDVLFITAAGGAATAGSTTGRGGNFSVTLGAAGGTGTAGAPGQFLIVGNTVGGANTTPFLNITGTWNTSGKADAGIFLNVTTTAEAAGSLLIDLQASGASKFSVDYTGIGAFATSVSTGTAPSCAPGTAGVLCQGEGTAPTAASAVDQVYSDSTLHAVAVQNNGGGPSLVNVTAPSPIRSTGLTASVATATLCAASAGACNQSGVYQIHFALYQSGAACSANTTNGVSVQLTWTDGNGTAHTAQTLPMNVGAGVLGTAGVMAWNATTLGAWGSAGATIDTNGTVIQYATTYANCTTGTATYALSAFVTRGQ